MLGASRTFGEVEKPLHMRENTKKYQKSQKVGTLEDMGLPNEPKNWFFVLTQEKDLISLFRKIRYLFPSIN